VGDIWLQPTESLRAADDAPTLATPPRYVTRAASCPTIFY
jgi:hypothetical protein